MTIRLSFASCLKIIELEAQDSALLFRGTPGIGKSTLLADFVKKHPEYVPAMIDCARLQAGETSMPVIDPVTRTFHWALSEDFCFDEGKPVIVYLDELGKATAPVQTDLLPLILEKRIGRRYLPKGSVVIGSTNLDSDGVGDRIPAHLYNRMKVMTMRGPSAPEWCAWATQHDVASEIVAWVSRTPAVLNEYTELQGSGRSAETNAYIFNPLTGNIKTFTSARSLAKLSTTVRNMRDKCYTHEEFQAIVEGSIGPAAALDFVTMFVEGFSLPSPADVLRDPVGAKALLPEDRPSCHFLMASAFASYAVQTRANSAVLNKLSLFARDSLCMEAQVLFVMLLARQPTMAMAAIQAADFGKMLSEFTSLIS